LEQHLIDPKLGHDLERFVGAYGLAVLGERAKAATPALRKKAVNRGDPLLRILSAYGLAQASADDKTKALEVLVSFGKMKKDIDTPFPFDGVVYLIKSKDSYRGWLVPLCQVLRAKEPGSRFPLSHALTWLEQFAAQPEEKTQQ